MGDLDKDQVCYHETVLSSSLEVALRLLILMSNLTKSADIHRLAVYDYLLLHSQDIKGGPESLHPATPVRTGELLVRRTQIMCGLNLLEARGLIEREYSQEGISFRTSQLATAFISYFDSTYAKKCGEVSRWVAKSFDPIESDELQELIRTRIGKWGVEFTDEPTED